MSWPLLAVSVIAVTAVVVIAGAWVLARLARAYGEDPTPMGTVKRTQTIRSPAEANAVRERAVARRESAGTRREQAHKTESGEPEDRSYKLIGWRR